MNTLDAILTRQSCRDFADGQITEEELQKLLVAANAAPVGMAKFDAMFLTVIQDKALLDQLDAETKKRMPHREHPLYNAPTLILVSVRKDEGRPFLVHQQSAACILENILLEATELGLASIYIMGAADVIGNSPEFTAAAKIPEGFAPIALAAVGHGKTPAARREETTSKIAFARA